MRITITRVVLAAIAGGLFLAIASPAPAEPVGVPPTANSNEIFLEPRLPTGELRIDSSDTATRGPDRVRALSSLPVTCDAGEPESCAGQLGAGGAITQECSDGNWGGLAFPIMTGGGLVDTVTFTVNTNRAGGDVYLTTNTTDVDGVCQPDVTESCPWDLNGAGNVGAADLAQLLAAWGTNPGHPADFNGDGIVNATDLAQLLAAWGDCPAGGILAALCCAISGQPATQEVELHFDPVMTSGTEPTWLVFSPRSDQAGQDGDGNFNGFSFPGHQVARDLSESAPNQGFANLVGTGAPGDWIDLHDLGDPGLGTHYCVDLSFTDRDPEVYDCVANPEPSGACCFVLDGTCQDLRGFECGIASQDELALYLGDDSDCAECPVLPEVCNEDAGSCTQSAGNGTPGCDVPECCYDVCSDPSFSFCCDVAWDELCAAQADLMCGLPTSFQVFLGSGPTSNIDGYLDVTVEEYGSWASSNFGGGGDRYNPVGFSLNEVAFTSGFFLFIKDPAGAECAEALGNCKRELLSDNDTWLGVGFKDDDDTSLFKQITLTHEDNPPIDTNGDGVDDTATSAFEVFGGETDLSFELEQHLFSTALPDGTPVGVLTQTYIITNNADSEVDLELLRAVDYDILWATDDFTDDSVGTATNGSPSPAGVYVFQKDPDHPATAITMSSPQATAYYGAKGGIDPDGDGPGPPFGFGTDTQQWDAFGMPESWANHIAGVGANLDGESDPSPGGGDCSPCDASIGLDIRILLGPGETVDVTIQYAYGAMMPFVP